MRRVVLVPARSTVRNIPSQFQCSIPSVLVTSEIPCQIYIQPSTVIRSLWSALIDLRLSARRRRLNDGQSAQSESTGRSR